MPDPGGGVWPTRAAPGACGAKLTWACWSRAKICEDVRWCPAASWVQRDSSHALWGALVPRLMLLPPLSSIARGVRVPTW